MHVNHPYKQVTIQGCLPVCLLALAGVPKTSAKSEMEIIDYGFRSSNYSYAVAMVQGAAAALNGYTWKVYIQSTAYARQVSAALPEDQIEIQVRKFQRSSIEKLRPPFAIYVNSRTFSGTYENAPHFVLVTSRSGSTLRILDPLDGIERTYSVGFLRGAIDSLSQELRFSPVAIKVRRSFVRNREANRSI